MEGMEEGGGGEGKGDSERAIPGKEYSSEKGVDRDGCSGKGKLWRLRKKRINGVEMWCQ